MRFNKTESIKNQSEFCKEKGYPNFSPSDGKCYSCNKDIYKPEISAVGENVFVVGIDVEKSKTHITGCPFCNISYCD